MMNLKTLLSIFTVFSACFIGCEPKDIATPEFKQYFQSTFHQAPENGRIYLLMPSNQCRYCIKFDASMVPGKLQDQLVIVSCFPPSDYKNFQKVYYDREQNMMALNLLDYTKCILLYDHDKVEKIIPVIDLYPQLDSLAHQTP